MRIFKEIIEWFRFDDWEDTFEYVSRVVVPTALILIIIGVIAGIIVLH